MYLTAKPNEDALRTMDPITALARGLYDGKEGGIERLTALKGDLEKEIERIEKQIQSLRGDF